MKLEKHYNNIRKNKPAGIIAPSNDGGIKDLVRVLICRRSRMMLILFLKSYIL